MPSDRHIPYSSFTSGSTVIPTNNTYLACQVIAGRRPCRFFLDIQAIVTEDVSTVFLNEICWTTYATEALADAAVTMGALFAGTANPSRHSFTDTTYVTTHSPRVRIGSVTTDLGANLDLPRSVTRSVDLAANGFFHVGNARMSPELTLAPYHVLHVQSVDQNVTGTYATNWYVGCEIEEEYLRNGAGL